MADKVTGVLNLLKGLVKQTPTSKGTDLIIPTKAELEQLPEEDLDKISNQLKEATTLDRRELMRGALGTIANTAMDVGTLRQLAKIAKPATKIESATKIDDLTNFFDLPHMIKLKYEAHEDYAYENIFDEEAWEILSSLFSETELKAMKITDKNAREKLLKDEKLLQLLADEDELFEENFKDTIYQELEEFLIDDSIKFEDLDPDIQETLEYLMNDKKMTLPEIRKFIWDLDY